MFINATNSDAGFGIAFSLGSFNVHWYSIFMFIAFLTVYLLSIYTAKKKGIESKPIENFIYILFPVSIIFARTFYVLGDLDSFKQQNWFNVIDVTTGGLSIEGGTIGGLIAGIFWFRRYSKIYNVSVWTYADCMLPNVLLGQAIGRWGNFFNQEILGSVAHSGLPFILPHFIRDHLHLTNDHPGVVRQPLFLYESFLDFIGWLALAIILPKLFNFKKGSYFAMYFIYYGFIRTIMEPFRYDVYIMRIGSVPISILISVLYFIFGVGLLIWLNWPNKIIKYLPKISFNKRNNKNIKWLPKISFNKRNNKNKGS